MPQFLHPGRLLLFGVTSRLLVWGLLVCPPRWDALAELPLFRGAMCFGLGVWWFWTPVLGFYPTFNLHTPFCPLFCNPPCQPSCGYTRCDLGGILVMHLTAQGILLVHPGPLCSSWQPRKSRSHIFSQGRCSSFRLCPPHYPGGILYPWSVYVADRAVLLPPWWLIGAAGYFGYGYLCCLSCHWQVEQVRRPPNEGRLVVYALNAALRTSICSHVRSDFRTRQFCCPPMWTGCSPAAPNGWIWHHQRPC